MLEALCCSRRSLLKTFRGLGAWAVMGKPTAEGQTVEILKKPIPQSGEMLPVVGLGTSRTFDVKPERAIGSPLQEVMHLFVERGGSMVDSSPMYGEAERVVGALAAELGIQKSLFLATKVWTRGKQAGIRQMEESMRRMRSERIDLIQVHSLSDWRTQLDMLKEWKKSGRIRCLGVTHYALSAFDEIADIIKNEGLDFIEIPYSIDNRRAEERLLPIAADHGTTVIAHTPYGRGRLFRRVKGRPLPPWAGDFDIQSWGSSS